jgi:hypothetical protein
LGSLDSPSATNIWASHTEHKCKFCAWLVMHNRVLTANNMLKKNWPCNQICSLCYYLQETTHHLLADCNYTEAVWDRVANSFNLPSYSDLQNEEGPLQWLNKILRLGHHRERRKRLGILLTVWWMIWKERNRRIFENHESSAPRLAQCILQAISLHTFAGIMPPN